MKLLKTMGAAFAALALGTMSIPTVASADPATPEQIQGAYDTWQAAIVVYNNAVSAYNDAENAWETSEETCWYYWVESRGGSPNYDGYIQCRYDAEDLWTSQYGPLGDDVNFAATAVFDAEGWYQHYLTCGNSC